MTPVSAPAIGVDLGTTFSAAAIHRDGRSEPVTLGQSGWSMPSVVHISESGEVIVGEAAEFLGSSAPERTFREFKRDLGSDVDIVTPSGPRRPEWFTSQILEHIMTTALSMSGLRSPAIAVTHPADWGPHRLDLLERCVADAGLDNVALLAEPVAAATHYASLGRIAPEETIAIYDFGGGTFDASVVRHNGTEIEIIGEPRGTNRIGGVDLDQIILELVDDALDGAVSEADVTDHGIATDLNALRNECTRAKIALSSDLHCPLRVRLGQISTELLIQRAEFEERIEPLISETVEVLQDAVGSADLEMHELSRVLLVGGSSRIPLVGQTISNVVQVPISIDIDAASAVAQGAATNAAGGGLRFQREADESAHLVRTPAPIQPVAVVERSETIGRPSRDDRERSANLVVHSSDGQRVEFPAGRTSTIGRAVSCDLRLADDLVSRTHAKVTHDTGRGWSYEDRSSNGSYVDDVAIERIDISAPTTISLGRDGPSVTLVPERTASQALEVEVRGELVYPTKDRVYVIGRRPPADIVVDDPQLFVSSEHLRLRHAAGNWSIVDLSRNGTYFPDGRRLDDSEHPLIGDAVVHLGVADGPTVTFRVVAAAGDSA